MTGRGVLLNAPVRQAAPFVGKGRLRGRCPVSSPPKNNDKALPDRENRMTDMTKIDGGLHHAAYMHADEVRAGKLSRREFLVRTTALGVSAAAAYGLLGLEAPAVAQDAPAPGGRGHAADGDGNQGPERPAPVRLVGTGELYPRLAGISGGIQCRHLAARHAAGKLVHQ